MEPTSGILHDDDQNLPAIKKALEHGGNDQVTALARLGLNHLFQHSESGSPEDYGTLTETFDSETLTLIGDWFVEHNAR